MTEPGFDQIYLDHWQKIFRLCMGYVNDRDIAKDLTQDTFLAVWQQLATFRHDSAIGTWIFRIAVNKCLSHLRQSKKMPKSKFAVDIKEDLPVNMDGEMAFLFQCISELPEIERIIISLELENIKQKEIAEIVGISEGNVRVRIHRIKEKLTKKFKCYGG